MYLRVNEQHYSMSLNDDSIIVNNYVCLFDDDYKIVDEVFVYLQSRLLIKRLAFNTVASKGHDLKIYYDFLKKYKLVYATITYKHINDFIAWLMLPQSNADMMHLNITSKRSAKTVNRIVSTIKDFYKFHEAMYNIENPFKYASQTIKRPTHKHKSFYEHTQNGLIQKSSFKIKEFDKGIRVLSKEQIETVLESTTLQRDRLLFELLLFTGIRIGEALSLEIDAIGVVKVKLEVQELKMTSNEDDYREGSSRRQQKTGIRDLFIPSQLMQKLNDYYEDTWLPIYEQKEMTHNYLFISEFHRTLGKPLSYQAVWERCRQIGKNTNIYFSPHDFRHTFATTLARNKVGIERLRKLLGHSHISSTSIYIEIANKEDIVKELIPFYQTYGVDV
ncbi:tyrosine-type recombinase/integrase (plasmid) [Sulfurimonas aquatica]|uniref:Tyrosine-type recombinase/integrase n=1 Tax=Sulfurimonas aquatica TaxID=2672570 RepID=A0A975GDY1_9BACT|nr:tyrosine-type recombinase/integrase [Sulfurimonas aquatica]QSZ43191.1 tyrosine-type recombinase/integrase [Sulfurimonas aquatica]